MLKKILIVLGLAVVALVVAGAVALPRLAAMGRSALWKTEKVDRGEMLVTVTATGSVEPVREVQIGSQVSGKVAEVPAARDQRVKQGEVLARLDRELLEAERKDREIEWKNARTALESLAVNRTELDLKEERLKLDRQRQQVAVERGQAALDLADKNLERYTELRKAEATSQTELDIRTLERDNSARDLRLLQLDLERLAVDLKQVAADRQTLEIGEKQARMRVEQAEAAVAKAVTNLGYAEITSPIDGIVLERQIEPGQTIAAQFQSPNLFKIVADLETVRIRSNIDEADVGRIRAGQKVTFEVDAFREETFEGVVQSVLLKHELKSNLVTYPVVIEAQNPPSEAHPFGRLLPGMTAYVTFEVERRTNLCRLPAAALRFAPPPRVPVETEPVVEKDSKDAKKEKDDPPPGMPATIYVLNEQGGLKSVTVRVGETDGEYYELLSDNLKPGDEVVTGSILGDAAGMEPK